MGRRRSRKIRSFRDAESARRRRMLHSIRQCPHCGSVALIYKTMHRTATVDNKKLDLKFIRISCPVCGIVYDFPAPSPIFENVDAYATFTHYYDMGYLTCPVCGEPMLHYEQNGGRVIIHCRACGWSKKVDAILATPADIVTLWEKHIKPLQENINEGE